MATSVNNTTSSSSSLIASLNAASSANGTSKTTADEMQTRFLNLLVTQLKNQDPLNPMDNNQMTTQLSQISTVSGIEKLMPRWRNCWRTIPDRKPCRRQQ